MTLLSNILPGFAAVAPDMTSLELDFPFLTRYLMQPEAVLPEVLDPNAAPKYDPYAFLDPPLGSVAWAMQEFEAGLAAINRPAKEGDSRLVHAIGHFGRALTVLTRERNPTPWARSKVGLGLAWMELRVENQAEPLRSAIAAFEDALAVHTPEVNGDKWANAQMLLGRAWLLVPEGDLADHAKKAIAAFDLALTVHTFEACPERWAQHHVRRGHAWQKVTTHLPPGVGAETAIGCFELALKAYPVSMYPVEWAKVQREIARAWRDMPTGDPRGNRRKAIAFFGAATRALSRKAHAPLCRSINYEEGLLWYALNRDEPGENLNEAMECFRIVLECSPQDGTSREWADAHYMLGVCSLSAEGGDFESDPSAAIEHLELALGSYATAKRAAEAGWTQCCLGAAWIELHSEDRDGDLRRAIRYLDAALELATRDADLGRWATVNCHLGHAWSQLSDGGELAAIRASKYFEAALSAWPSDKFPTEHASVMKLLLAMRARTTNAAQSVRDGSTPCAA